MKSHLGDFQSRGDLKMKQLGGKVRSPNRLEAVADSQRDFSHLKFLELVKISKILLKRAQLREVTLQDQQAFRLRPGAGVRMMELL